MALSLILIGLAILGGFSLFLVARAQRSQLNDLNELTARIQPVDLQAFQNLTSATEEAFLIMNLSPKSFRSVQRRRLIAAIDYVQGVAANAVILMRMGQLAQNSSDSEIVRAGRELGEAASQLRLYSLLVVAKLYMGVILPGNRLSPGRVVRQYEDLCRHVSRLSRLRVAVGAPRISATL